MFRLALKFCEASNGGGGCSQLRVGLFYSILLILMITVASSKHRVTFFCVRSHILLSNNTCTLFITFFVTCNTLLGGGGGGGEGRGGGAGGGLGCGGK